MIKTFAKAYIRHYSDNGQTKCYVEWLDYKGRSGRTEGEAGEGYPLGQHMRALVAAAARQGVMLTHEEW